MLLRFFDEADPSGYPRRIISITIAVSGTPRIFRQAPWSKWQIQHVPSPSATAAERDVAMEMLDEVVEAKPQRAPGQAITLGADTQYQDAKFIAALRERAVAPHVSEYTKGVANLGKNALNEAERADARRSISQRKRKLIERVFGWGKQDRPLRQIKLRGLQRVDWFFRLVVTAYNLMRLGRLVPIPAEVG